MGNLVAFSFNRNMDELWLPYFGAGYSDGSGALAERASVQTLAIG
jgi:hypothetical protein